MEGSERARSHSGEKESVEAERGCVLGREDRGDERGK